jgi:nitric oxide reductase subunit B
VPYYWLPIGGFFSALEPVALVGMAIYAYSAMRRSGLAHPNTLALHWTIGSAVFTMFGAGLLGLAHTWPSVNKWTHGTLITPMHGHAAFYGAYAMIVLAVIAYALPTLTENRPARENPLVAGSPEAPAEVGRTLGYWAFWLQLAGMFGMTISFATAGIAQVYLERILGLGFLETQLKIQVHFLMLLGSGFIFTVGAALYIWDFFRTRPRFTLSADADAAEVRAPSGPRVTAVT